MLFVTDTKVEKVIDRLLTRSEELAPAILTVSDRQAEVRGTPAGHKANEILIDAKLLHEDLLSLAAQFRFRSIPKKAAYFQSEMLSRRLDVLAREVAEWPKS